jgi:hypothetical protein
MNRPFRLKILLPTLAAVLVAPGLAGSRPGSLEVRVPPALAARLAQESLGQPSDSSDSVVELKIPLVDAQAKNIRLRKASKVVRIYGQNVFGVRFDTPFALALRIFDLGIRGKVTVRSVRFAEVPRSHGEELDVELGLEIRDVAVSSPKIWVREDGLTTPSNLPAAAGCPEKKRPIHAFAGQSIWAEVTDAAVVPKTEPGANERGIQAVGRFRVRKSTAEEEEKTGERLVVEPLSIEHDAAKVLGPHYQLLTGKLEVPTVWLKIDGECFKGDPSGIEAFFGSVREKLKEKIVEGVSKSLSKIAMKAATKALAKLEIPAGKEFRFKSSPTFEPPRQIPVARDKTYVAPPKLLTLEREKTASKVPAESPLLEGLLWEIHARLALQGFSVGNDGALGIGLSDDLSVNGRTQGSVDSSEFGNLPPLNANYLRVLLNRAFFESKAGLLEALTVDYAGRFPPELRLGKKGIEVHPRKDGRLSLVAHLEVDLTDSLLRYLAKAGGNPEAVFRIPVQLNVAPEIATVDGRRVLRLNVAIHDRLLENEFGQRSNLDRTFTRLVTYLEGKIRDFNTKLKENPKLVPLEPLEAKSPLRAERVFFTDTGAFAADLSLSNVRPFVKKKKKGDAP